MTEDSRPLHVQVADAIGWTDLHPGTYEHWFGREPTNSRELEVPKYGQNFCSTGPFLERFRISLAPIRGLQDDSSWLAMAENGSRGESTRPCEAIAFCVLSLHRSGKLKL